MAHIESFLSDGSTRRILPEKYTDEDAAAEKTGIGFWMERVASECDRVTFDLAPDAVHDLRVALRRCRSIAEGFRSFDPSPEWRRMRKESGRLLKKLGELRDIHVMAEWMKNPGAPRDAAHRLLLDHISGREDELKKAAAAALGSFDRRKWAAWAARLSRRSTRIPPEGNVFRHLALERWNEACSLHRQALRNRSHIGFHRLRIGLKKFRYTVENFLPGLHREWGADLRDLQDLLGEMHDLHVLVQTAIDIHAIQSRTSRDPWNSWIKGEIGQRLDRYRRNMTGENSMWKLWRAALPQGEQLKSAAIERLETWASFRDPHSKRSMRVVRLALQLHDGLASQNLLGNAAPERSRAILKVAAQLHAVGATGCVRKMHKKSYRMINKLKAPVGWAPEDFKLAALVVRYHRGALPAAGHEGVRDLTEEQRQLVALLAGILRLAVAFTVSQQTEIPSFEICRSGQVLGIRASAYDKHSPLAQKLARDRYLLEIACGLPVVIQSRFG